MQPELIGGRYRVESAIGRGGMGTVWLCTDEVLHRHVAVKQVGLLPGESVTDSARALREARSSAGLSHHNVVTVFDVVEEGGHIWLVMEHVPGRSLSQMIRQDGPLDPATVAGIGAQVADGLAALHRNGTVHRDVKPGNVLVRDDGVAKISDFGIARTDGDPTLTQSGYLTGTPSYFSPALARGLEPTAADDVWALGATLYAAAEGHPPYPRRSNPVEVLHDITSTQPQRPQRAEFLEPALQRMLDRDPDSRWTMTDAQHTLRRLADTHRPDATLAQTRTTPTAHEQQPVQPTVAPSSARRVQPEDAAGGAEDVDAPVPSPAPATAQRKAPRRRGRAAMILVALLLAVGGVAFAATQLGDDQQPSSTPGAKGTKDDGSKDSQESSADPASSSSADDKEAFIRDYYAAAPGGSDEAWQMLAPEMKTMGRDRYLGFWRTVEAVDVRQANATSEGNTVEVTLVYRTTDGGTSTERKREVLRENDDGGYQIVSDEPAS